ncbi:hypothetical protein [Thalassococcus sp. S3]|uniref:hypothetical protein n=1 Tax=Thalassococcus sp. S3 TaxID=2017482 RepID=UPI0010246D37|nr:hypothetical protein [Thalassococcus sp. S3]QBF29738.1 hypothetical protein CFI11_00715 [Thalassococcus sp. S3]
MNELRETIRNVFESHFEGVKLAEFEVREDLDHDGDPILRIKFVFETEDNRLDPKKVKSMIRHLREPLAEIGEDRFPITSYMTKEEFDGEAA